MKPSFEKLVPQAGESFRCFNRRELRSPVKWHRHPEIELTFVEHGSGTRLVGDDIGTYTDGDLVLLGSGLPHTWLSDKYRGQSYDRHPAFVIQFHPDFLGSEFFAIAELRPVAEVLQRAQRGLWFPRPMADGIGSRIKRMLGRHGAARLIELLACLQGLADCEDAVPLATEAYVQPSNKAVETRIQRICNYVSRHLVDPDLSQEKLSDLVYMNRSAFSRFFKRATGRTVSGYINELRIGLACRLLVETEQSVLEISLQSGFENASNFNRRFRQLRGTTPRAYRSRYQTAS